MKRVFPEDFVWGAAARDLMYISDIGSGPHNRGPGPVFSFCLEKAVTDFRRIARS